MTMQRYFTMLEVTDAVGRALGSLPAKDRAREERLLFLFVDGIVRELKLLPDRPSVPRRPQKSDD